MRMILLQTSSILLENADIFQDSLDATINATKANQEWNTQNNFKITSWFFANSQ